MIQLSFEPIALSNQQGHGLAWDQVAVLFEGDVLTLERGDPAQPDPAFGHELAGGHVWVFRDSRSARHTRMNDSPFPGSQDRPAKPDQAGHVKLGGLLGEIPVSTPIRRLAAATRRSVEAASSKAIHAASYPAQVSRERRVQLLGSHWDAQGVEEVPSPTSALLLEADSPARHAG